MDLQDNPRKGQGTIGGHAGLGAGHPAGESPHLPEVEKERVQTPALFLSKPGIASMSSNQVQHDDHPVEENIAQVTLRLFHPV